MEPKDKLQKEEKDKKLQLNSITLTDVLKNAISVVAWKSQGKLKLFQHTSFIEPQIF